MKSRRLFIHAACIADGERACHCPGAILIDRPTGRVVAVDSPQGIGRPEDAEICDRSGSVVIPALVNAHAHLDLTHIGPLPWPPAEAQSPADGGFAGWADLVRTRRAADDEQIRASVMRGVELSVAGGTGFIGDIAGVGAIAATDALRDSTLCGVSYLEFFGQGAKEDAALALLDRLEPLLAEPSARGVRIGLQPHAPYSCSRRVYRAAAKLSEKYSAPMATHLAESLEELAFVRDAEGPLAEMLRRLGIWDHRIEPTGQHPIDYLADVLAAHPMTAAHLNYVSDAHLDQLADWPISIAYCPRASAYFGHPVHETGQPATHRYRDMAARGINVALGTDSMLCLDTPNRISVLDEMRLLLQRDGVEPRELLRMATVGGARALGVDRSFVTFAPGSTPGILALPIGSRDADNPLRGALASESSVASLEYLLKPNVNAPSSVRT